MFNISRIREMGNVMCSGHSMAQKINYLKYLTHGRREVLSYDPITISIVATGRCTLSCDMCPTHSRIVPRDYPHAQKSERDMGFGMFREMIDSFPHALNVQIIGSGEPLLNKDFFRMVDYAAGKQMTVKTFSNGTTIRENIDRILDSKLDGITISINGHDAKEFGRITGMGEDVYREICEAVKQLAAAKRARGSDVRIKLSFILDRYNYRFIPEMIDTFLELGVDHAFFCNFLPCPYQGLSADERVLMAEGKLADEIGATVKKYPPSVRKRITLPALVDKDLKANRCRSHFSQIRFDGDGNVSSCSMMLLNMTAQGYYKDKDVWNNDFFRKMRQAFLANDDGLLQEPCRVCPDNKGVCIN